MQDSFLNLLKLLLPEIIVEYFELASYEKGEVQSQFLQIFLITLLDRPISKPTQSLVKVMDSI